MNSLKKGEGVPLLNFAGGPGTTLLNFEGGPGVPLLNFRGVPGLTFKLWGGSRGPGSWSHFYAMAASLSVFINRCSENMQQIYRRISLSKWDINKFALKLHFDMGFLL